MRCASSLIGHDALGGGYDRDTQATENLGQLVCAGVDTQARLGNTAQAGQSLFVAVVLQGDADGALGAVVDQLVVLI